MSQLSTRYSVKCAALRTLRWIACSEGGGSDGKSQCNRGMNTRPVCSLLNQPVEKSEISAAQPRTGSQRRKRTRSGDLGDDTIHERQDVVIELGVDEALDLLALRRVPPPTRLSRELRPRDDIQVLEHRRLRGGIDAGEEPIEDEPHGEKGQAVFEFLVEFHSPSAGSRRELVLFDDERVVVVRGLERAIDDASVEEQCRGRGHPELEPDLDVLDHARSRLGRIETRAERGDLDADVPRVAEQAVAVERLLMLEELIVILPEPSLFPRA